MSFDVRTIAYFDKQLKRLAKKHPSLKKEYINLVDELKTNPAKGTPLGHDCYKIRLAIASKNKGKSGGGRVITYISITELSVTLLSIYDKSEHDTISDKELLLLLDHIE